MTAASDVPVTPEEDALFRELELVDVEHEPIDGIALMPAGWCGGCEHCDRYPEAPDFCGRCYLNGKVYEWPCPYVTDVQTAQEGTQ